MPRKKDPDNVKQMRGTARPSRLHGEWVEFEAVEDAPEPPQYLPVQAANYWRRLVPILLSKRVLSIADLESLEVLCVLYGRVRQMTEAGIDIQASLVTQLRLYQSEFGLTPVSRQKVGSGGEKPKGNAFANNGRKPATK